MNENNNGKYFHFVPNGHYYSPIPSKDDVLQHIENSKNIKNIELGGVDLNLDVQLKYLNEFIKVKDDIKMYDKKTEGYRYYQPNDVYNLGCAMVISCLMKKLKPKRIIEVGSGFSSAQMLDMNEKHFNNSIELTFIEPYPNDWLNGLLKKEDNSKLYECNLQDVDITIFDRLEENDILFIDSSHVSKLDSDVNKIIFEILPRLKSGVYIHFHDIFYPFVYPHHWLLDGRAWNEAYILRSFLMYNNAFDIVFWGTYLNRTLTNDNLEKLKSIGGGGGSIYIRKK